MNEDGMFRHEIIACPLCGSIDFKVLGRKKDTYYGRFSSRETAQIARCINCSLIYANPMPFPKKDNFTELYNEDYTKMLSNVPYKELRNDFVDIFEGHRRLKRLEAILGRKGLMLDVGCGPGNLICVARERGWKAIGLEINERSARFAREINKVEVVDGRIEDYAEQWAGRFDAIHFNQVLEHTYDPIRFLRSLGNVIRHDGAFFCGVPNEDGLMNNLAQVYFKFIKSDFTQMLSPTFYGYHVLGFSPKTIRLIFQKTGFKVSHIEHVNYSCIDIEAFKSGQILKGIKSIVELFARALGHGHGLDVYGSLLDLNCNKQ